MQADTHNALGSFLKDRRARLNPQALGLQSARRRTPGLRREEVAHRASISATWYTWLEQGRGGAPSPQVLHRIAAALMLTEAEREHLFLLGLGRPPEVQYREASGVTPRLQQILDALVFCPALVKTSTWDVVAWNRAAALVLTDYGSIAPEQRNILRLMFCEPRARQLQTDWLADARFVVAAFRADVAKAGATAEATALIEELSSKSQEFKRIWRANDVLSYGEGVKRLQHPMAGLLALEYSAFAVDLHPNLSMLVFHPQTEEDRVRILAMVM